MNTSTSNFFKMRVGGSLAAMVVAATLAAVVVVLILWPALPAQAQGATITVDTTADEQPPITNNGNCTLREAIQAANTNAVVDQCPAGSATDEDTIVFAPGVSGTITLSFTPPPPEITDPQGLTIDGENASITISGNPLLNRSTAKLSVKNLTVSFGGIHNEGGILVVSNTFFSHNSATGDSSGIFNEMDGTATVTNSTFSEGGGPFGAGIYNLGATLTVSDSTFSYNVAHNPGIRIICNPQDPHYQECLHQPGVVPGAGAGGGISNNSSGTATVINSTFVDNVADGGEGGGIANLEGSTLEVTNSTFASNGAYVGGGIASGGSAGAEGSLVVTNSTFSGNSAGTPPGGTPYGGAIATVFGTTPTVTLLNTIVANSTSDTSSGNNCTGTIADGGYNLEFPGTTCGFSGTSKPNTDPQFDGGLANNGGPTQTIALKPTSPAVDAIPQGVNQCATTTDPITTDQRGVSRPQGTGCDIGAFELQQGGGGNPPSGPQPGHHHKHKHHGHHGGHHHKHKGSGGGGGGGISQGGSVQIG